MPGIIDQVRELTSCLEGTDIELLELELGNDVIRLRRNAFSRNAAPPPPEEIGMVSFDIPAPSVGIFHGTHPLQTAPLAEPGQRVTAGDAVALLQIGSLLVHVVAPQDGTLLEVLAEDGAAVGYGTALMRFRESENE